MVVLLPSLRHRSRCSGCRLRLVWVIWRKKTFSCLLVLKLWSILILTRTDLDLWLSPQYETRAESIWSEIWKPYFCTNLICKDCNNRQLKIVQEVWSLFCLQHTLATSSVDISLWPLLQLAYLVFLKFFSCMSSVFQDLICIIYDFCQCCGGVFAHQSESIWVFLPLDNGVRIIRIFG